MSKYRCTIRIALLASSSVADGVGMLTIPMPMSMTVVKVEKKKPKQHVY